MCDTHDIVQVREQDELDGLLFQEFTYPLRGGWIDIGEQRTRLPAQYRAIADEIENFDVRNDDIFVVSYPRSGTTWTQEMVWLIENDCDFEAARRMIHGRYVYLEGSAFAHPEVYKEILKHDKHMDISYMKSIQEQRFIKTHLPWELLPKKVRDGSVTPKFIWVYRNPKDVCVSCYHFFGTLHNATGSLGQFCKLFLAGRAHYGSYWSHFYSFWRRRRQSNILCIRYEDMKFNMRSVLEKVSEFMGRPIRDYYMDQLLDHLSFETMKRNTFCNNQMGIDVIRELAKEEYKNDGRQWTEKKDREHTFMRKGKVGSHKEEMSEDTIRRFDAWIAENAAHAGVTFE